MRWWWETRGDFCPQLVISLFAEVWGLIALVTISPANVAADATFNHINYVAQLQNKGLWPAPLEKQAEQIPKGLVENRNRPAPLWQEKSGCVLLLHGTLCRAMCLCACTCVIYWVHMREQNEKILCMRSRECAGESRAPLHIEERKGVVGAGGWTRSPLAVFRNTVFLTILSWYLRPKGEWEHLRRCGAAQQHSCVKRGAASTQVRPEPFNKVFVVQYGQVRKKN